MVEELRLPVLAAVALTVWLVCSLAQLRRRRSTDPRPVWRERGTGPWTRWHELPAGPVVDHAVNDLAACALEAEAMWPDSTNVAYHRLLNAALDQAGPTGSAVQFAIVRTPKHAPAYTEDLLFVSPVYDRKPRAAAA